MTIKSRVLTKAGIGIAVGLICGFIYGFLPVLFLLAAGAMLRDAVYDYKVWNPPQ